MTPPSRVREFVAPWPLAAVVVMAVNDFWLKPTLHNDLTGKLSDFAICFFLPLYASALLGLARVPFPARLYTGAAVSAALFVSLKTSPAFALLYVATLERVGRPLGFDSFAAVVDPTDLIALPLVAVAVWHARRTCASTVGPVLQMKKVQT